jgi:2-polyprenyl-3-methyl-5-hydroxy-6-metoxy-1,4-benzoquinol methylase
MDAYILDDSMHIEYERLDLMSKILDPWTRGYLDALGVGPGWRCLELGGGNGSITEWLAGRVGPSGAVTSLDINTTLLQLVPDQNVTVRQCDVRTDDLPTGFDLVMCRAMLHQISQHADAVLAKMAASLKPGGWLFIQEPDFHLAPTTEPQQWADVWAGILEWGTTQGVDWFIGRRLPSVVAGLGLDVPQAKTDVQNIRGRDRGALYFQLFFAEVRDRVIASGHVDAAAFAAANALLADPTSWTQCWMMTAMWARKPLG